MGSIIEIMVMNDGDVAVTRWDDGSVDTEYAQIRTMIACQQITATNVVLPPNRRKIVPMLVHGARQGMHRRAVSHLEILILRCNNRLQDTTFHRIS